MDFTKKHVERRLVLTTSKVLESTSEDKTECQLRVNDQLSNNERTVEKIEEYFNISKQTIDKMKTENKMLKFEVRVKEFRIAIVEQDIREKDATIKQLRAQLCEGNKEPNINSTNLCHENGPSGNPPESMYKEKNGNYYQTPARKAFLKFESENLKRRRLSDTIKAPPELDQKQTTSSIHPISGCYVNNYLSNGSPPLKNTIIKGKKYRISN